tara:strand:+ start:1690 stop:1821 length:132 start_codon:yes stop_codon:yes gene_type:complete
MVEPRAEMRVTRMRSIMTERELETWFADGIGRNLYCFFGDLSV